MRGPDDAVLDDYLRSLGERLDGPERLKADLLAETRDSLVDAVEAYRREGLDVRAAQCRAVSEFGSAAELAPAYQAELVAGHGRRYAWLVLLLPASMLTADLMWWRHPEDTATPPALFLLLVHALDLASYAAGLLAVLALLLLGPAGRWWPVEPRRVVRPLAAATLAAVVLIWSVGSVAAVRAVWESPDALRWPPMLLAWVLLNAVFGLLVRATLRMFAATGTARATG